MESGLFVSWKDTRFISSSWISCCPVLTGSKFAGGSGKIGPSCHEQGFDLDRSAPAAGTRIGGTCPPAWKFADIGVHEFRILVTAGSPAAVEQMMPGLADHLAAPPAAYAHLPYDSGKAPSVESLITLAPASIRLFACKRSWDGEALIVRLQEAVGRKTKARLGVAACAAKTEKLVFGPFEIKTLRVERDGTWRPDRLIEEDGP